MAPVQDPLSPALETALRRFAGEVRRIASSFRLAGDDIDELEQEIRLRLWKTLRTGEKIGGAPASYVRQVARSAAIDLFRRRRSRREESLPEGGAQVPMTAPTVENELTHSDFSRALAGAIDALVASRQGPVRMYLAGYQREEIAELMGWTEAKTRNLLYRGLDDLREGLTAMGITPEAVT